MQGFARVNKIELTLSLKYVARIRFDKFVLPKNTVLIKVYFLHTKNGINWHPL